jgi:deoxyribodipyrimidine photo-lyase
VTTSVVWFRRDLRLADHPALLTALDAADEVVPLFVLDPVLLGPAGAPRTAFLLGCLDELRERTGGALVIRAGDPAVEVPRAAAEVESDEVHVTADHGPYGTARDEAVAAALDADGRDLVREGSPYAVPPGTVTTKEGTPFKVFTPFFRAWQEVRRQPPADAPRRPAWASGLDSDALPPAPDLGGTSILPPGERAGLARLDAFLGDDERAYAERRDRPDLDGTSRLSPYLKYGCVHPRQVLARLGRSQGAETFRSELAWREFYADVLAHQPRTAREALRAELGGIRLDEGPEADERFAAWAEGRTGFPIVDAGMRQLLGEAWVHNRVRMIVASFLVKDLHIDWVRGARHFLAHLQDGDLASNNHGWQWVAGTGTDAAPYFRVFNPVTQGRRFDPDGDYVRRWVPELRGIDGVAVHEPWLLEGPQGSLLDGGTGYPARIVDHAEERDEALARYQETRATR